MSKDVNEKDVIGNILGNFLYDQLTEDRKEILLKVILLKLLQVQEKIDKLSPVRLEVQDS